MNFITFKKNGNIKVDKLKITNEIVDLLIDFDAKNMGGALYRMRVDVQGKAEHVASWG